LSDNDHLRQAFDEGQELGTQSEAARWREALARDSENSERHVYTTGGIKDNRSKPRVDLLPSLPLIEISKVMSYGASRYGDNNWRLGLPWCDTYGSIQRHLLAWKNREDIDADTRLSHLAHAGAQLLYLLEYELTHTGTDDRWTPPKEEA